MSAARSCLRAVCLLPIVLPLLGIASTWAQGGQSSRGRILGNVNAALSEARRGNFALARGALEVSLARCPAGPSGQECRTLYASGLGSLLYQQAATDRKNSDTLYRSAAGFYDRILAESPDNAEALYGKALSYRALGPHEWMESFYQDAVRRDPVRQGLYLTFLGDYYVSADRPLEAVRAYERAVQRDADDDGARSGLVEALAAARNIGRLLDYAEDWESRYPGSAADAYRALLTVSFGQGGGGDATADTAVVGLTRVQARSRLSPGQVPPEVSPDWTPVRELREYLDRRSAAAPWWTRSQRRREALAEAALAAGQEAMSQETYAAAESLWIGAARLAAPSSPVTLGLQRELALLYFRRPELDPGGRKFEELERRIFSGKGGALRIGDLEAAQRFHTTLGLIYAARNVWAAHGPRSARSQLAWALDKAEQREQVERFRQPLPELRMVLARALDSLGDRRHAAEHYIEAVAAFLDADDLVDADSALRLAAQAGEYSPGPARVLTLRKELAGNGGGDAACAADRIETMRGEGSPAFYQRQRFKVLADCVESGRFADSRARAIMAYHLVDGAGVGLIGGGDVERMDRVMLALLEPSGVELEASHLDPERPIHPPAIPVSLPGESRPLWYVAAEDAVVAARAIAALGAGTRPFRLRVVAGILWIPAGAGVTTQQVRQLEQVPGVKEVRTSGY